MINIGKLLNRSDRNRKESGQSLVELAASLFVLLILLSGIVDMGRAIFTLFSLQDAAEEGIVYGVGFPTDCSQIVQRVRSNLTNRVLPEFLNVAVTINGTSCFTIPVNQVFAGGEMVIEVSTDFVITMPFLGAFTGQTIPLRADANGIILRPQPLD